MEDKSLKAPNTREKENTYMSKMIYPTSSIKFILGLISIISIFLFWVIEIKGFTGLSFGILSYSIAPIIFILSLIFLKSTVIDIWVPHIASARVGSSYCKIGMKSITIDYDLLHSKKTIIKFIDEITEKSEDYNYFLHHISPRSMTIKLRVRPKVNIPEVSVFEGTFEENEKWNYIPLGITLTKDSVLGSINWILNDREKIDGSYRDTIPSTSILVTGGTGSGKSVLENNIIRHINKYSYKFQGILLDIKRVEFGGYSDVKGIKTVALDINECKEALEAARSIMSSRFEFMERAGAKNIYNLKNFKCSYYMIKNHSANKKKIYQFDEIVTIFVDGVKEITTIDKVYSKIIEGKDIEIMLLEKSKYSIGQEKDKEKDLVIREIFAGENFYINNDIYFKNDIIRTNTGIIKAVDMYDGVYDRKLEYTLINGIKIDESNCKIVECIFEPKVILVVVDELNEVMETTDFKAQISISLSISSIARLGRAAACHLCLATQRPNGNVISSDLKNNIQMSTILGGFGSSESMLTLDEDLSDFSKPEIKGRGFVKSGNEIIEYQSFFIEDTNFEIKEDFFKGHISVSKDSNNDSFEILAKEVIKENPKLNIKTNTKRNIKINKK